MREEVLAIRRNILGPNDLLTIQAMNDLAVSYYWNDRKDESMKLHEGTLALKRRIRGPEHLDTLREMTRLGFFYYGAGRKNEALKLREEVFSLCRKVLGAEGRDTLVTMTYLAISYFDDGRKGEALKLLEEFSFYAAGMKDLQFLEEAIDDLAKSLHGAGRHDEPIELRKERLTIQRKVLGPEHPDTLNAMNHLANSYFSAGRQNEASKIYEELIQLQPKNPAILNEVAWPLVSAPDQEGNYPRAGEAVEWARQACELAPNNCSFMNTLGTALYRVEQWQEATDALWGSTNNGFDVPGNWLFIAMAHWHLDDKAKAKEWYDKSLAWQTANPDAAKAKADAELQRFYAEAAKLYFARRGMMPG